MTTNSSDEKKNISDLAENVLNGSKKWKKRSDVNTSGVFSLIRYGIKKRASLGALSPDDLKIAELASWRYFLNFSFLVMLAFSLYGSLVQIPAIVPPLTWMGLFENQFDAAFLQNGLLFFKHPYGIMFFIVAVMGLMGLHVKPSLLAPVNIFFLLLMVTLLFNFLKFNTVITTIVFILLFPTYFVLAHFKERFVLRELYAEQPMLADSVRPLYVMIGQAFLASMILKAFFGLIGFFF